MLFIFSTLQIIRQRCVEQCQPDDCIDDSLPTQPLDLGNAKACEQQTNGPIEDRVPKIICPRPLRLQDVQPGQFLQRVDLFLMPILAGKRIIYERGAIGTQPALAVFAESDGGCVWVIVTVHGKSVDTYTGKHVTPVYVSTCFPAYIFSSGCLNTVFNFSGADLRGSPR